MNRRMGMTAVMEETIAYLSHTDGDTSTDYRCWNACNWRSLSYRESHLAMEMLAEADIITSAEFVEVNTILDERNRSNNSSCFNGFFIR